MGDQVTSVCFFLESGRTFTFRQCRIVCDNESVIVVEYVAMSDGATKTVTMMKSRIVGWSVAK